MKARIFVTGLGLALIYATVVSCLCWMAVVLFVSSQLGLFITPPLAKLNARQYAFTEHFTADARTCLAAMAYLFETETDLESVPTNSLVFQRNLAIQQGSGGVAIEHSDAANQFEERFNL